jgi:TRAP-type C4-dicarboxylate transport system substrate-binding protein
VGPGTAQAPPASIANMKPVTLRYNDFGPLRREIIQPVHWWAEELEKRTGGKIKVQFHGSSELGKATEQIDNVQNKVFEMGLHCWGFQAGKTPLTMVTTLPFVSNDVVAMGKAALDLVEVPEIKAELERVGLVVMIPTPTVSYQLLSRKPIKSSADLKGLKVRSIGYQAKALQRLGAVPVALPTSEMYVAMERGVIDAALWVIQGELDAYGFTGVTNHAVEIDAGALAPCAVIMNREVLRNLPAEAQQLMRELAAQTPTLYKEVYRKGREKDEKALGARGVKIMRLPDTELKTIEETAGPPVWKDWETETNQKGLPGSKVLSFWLGKVKQYSGK